LAPWRQSPQEAPLFTDSEVLTIALWQGCLGVASLKQTYRLVAHNGRAAFPPLCWYQQWRARLPSLTAPSSALLVATAQIPPGSPAFYLIDAKPWPVCHRVRHGRVRLLREDGADGGKTSQGWFFGFKLPILRHLEGRMVKVVLTPGNWDDRAPALTRLQAVNGGVTLGDLGYRGQPRAAEGAEEAEMLVLTRADAPEQKGWLAQVRQAIATSFSQWWYNFLDRVFSRSGRGLWNTIQLKLIHHNLCQAGVLSN
jgi:hypothetical protein